MPSHDTKTSSTNPVAHDTHVLPLNLDTVHADVRQIGGKAEGLRRLIELGMPVPAGFVVTADAYRQALRESGLGDQIGLLCGDETLSAAARSTRLRELFSRVRLPASLTAQIDRYYREMGGGPVAVRSSGIAEDTAAASFAGQHDTYLFVDGVRAVCEQVVRCWASLHNEGAIAYRARFGVPPEDVAMAVVVQRMVPALAGGVMMTIEPVQGDPGQIFIESAHGLGEGVVAGDVDSDRYWFDKGTLSVLRTSIGKQTCRHAFSAALGHVVLQPLDPETGARPSLDDELAARVAALGRDVEAAFGKPMDVEWAISPEREVLLLQARPETVWSGKPARAAVGPAAGRGQRSTMHEDLSPDSYYSTANLGEAAPGVLAPLTWSVWGSGAEIAARYGFIQMGVLERSKAAVPADPRDRFITVAFGRAVASVSAFYEMGERIPGASGDMIAESLLGSVPGGMTSSRTKRRYPHVLWNMPRAFVTTKRKLVCQHHEIAQWWSLAIARTPTLGLAEAQAQFIEACRKFHEATAYQAQSNIIAIPPVYQQLESLVARAGMRDEFGKLTAGGGDHAETDVVADLWELAKGRLDEAEFLARHGYHGTMEGNVAGTVWREDPSPVRRIAALYREQDDSKDPRLTAQVRASERRAAEAKLLSRVGPLHRPPARLVLWLARRNMAMRGVGKASFLRSLDVARAAARRIGELYVASGALDQVDDVMYLTSDELSGSLPCDVRELIASRKAEHALYSSYEIPTAFWGEPTPAVRQPAVPAARRPAEDSHGRLEGTGVSAGVVEGAVRVVTDPSFAEVQPGEILVASTTDPSWASIMLISAALVVDIGGALSHAAVVARELGVPCIVNTRNGTSRLRTGDRVRVDGAAGTVELISPAE